MSSFCKKKKIPFIVFIWHEALCVESVLEEISRSSRVMAESLILINSLIKPLVLSPFSFFDNQRGNHTWIKVSDTSGTVSFGVLIPRGRLQMRIIKLNRESPNNASVGALFYITGPEEVRKDRINILFEQISSRPLFAAFVQKKKNGLCI